MSRAISTLTSTSISMASASSLLLALVLQGPPQGPAPAPLRLSFAAAIRQATGATDSAPADCGRTGEATARVRQARSGLLPSLSLNGSWANRSFSSKAQGLSFPGLPTIIGPFNAYDARAQVHQTIVDFSNFGRVNAAKSQVRAAGAEESAAVEASAQSVALAYARATRAQAVVMARRADSSLAAELVGLAVAQQQAGVSASIDVTRARAQLVEAEGQLLVATNQLDRARIDLARSLGLDPATPIALTDTLSASLGQADVPADREAAVAKAVTARPDLAAGLGW